MIKTTLISETLKIATKLNEVETHLHTMANVEDAYDCDMFEIYQNQHTALLAYIHSLVRQLQHEANLEILKWQNKSS